jgi:hypothetical protein
MARREEQLEQGSCGWSEAEEERQQQPWWQQRQWLWTLECRGRPRDWKRPKARPQQSRLSQAGSLTKLVPSPLGVEGGA